MHSGIAGWKIRGTSGAMHLGPNLELGFFHDLLVSPFFFDLVFFNQKFQDESFCIFGWLFGTQHPPNRSQSWAIHKLRASLKLTWEAPQEDLTNHNRFFFAGDLAHFPNGRSTNLGESIVFLGGFRISKCKFS